MHAVLLSCLLVLIAATMLTTVAGLIGARATPSGRASATRRRWYLGVSLTHVGDRVVIIAGGVGGATVGLSQPARRVTEARSVHSHGQLPQRLGLDREWFTELGTELPGVPPVSPTKPEVDCLEPTTPAEPYRAAAHPRPTTRR